jgi:hypothetical protein
VVFDAPRLLFERIFDAEYGKANDKLAVLLAATKIHKADGRHRYIEFVTDRIAKIALLRDAVTVNGIQPIEKFIQKLGYLPWYLDIPRLQTVLAELLRIYSGLQWFVQEQILHFVHRLCYANMMVLPKPVARTIFDKVLGAYCQNDRPELRDQAVRVVRMLIPVIWTDLGDFYLEAVDREKNQVVAAAHGVALLGAVSIINSCPEWLPELLRLLEVAHRRVPKYTKAVEAQFGDFWKVIGAREFEAIEEFRYSISGSYFS